MTTPVQASVSEPAKTDEQARAAIRSIVSLLEYLNLIGSGDASRILAPITPIPGSSPTPETQPAGEEVKALAADLHDWLHSKFSMHPDADAIAAFLASRPQQPVQAQQPAGTERVTVDARVVCNDCSHEQSENPALQGVHCHKCGGRIRLIIGCVPPSPPQPPQPAQATEPKQGVARGGEWRDNVDCPWCERSFHANEIDRLYAENAAMRKAMEKIALEHEDQSQAWGGEEGDPDNSKYHAKWAKIARAALASAPPPPEENKAQ